MLYNNLSEKERALIEFMFYQERRSLNSIAKELNRHRSTISRELKRNMNFVEYIILIMLTKKILK